MLCESGPWPYNDAALTSGHVWLTLLHPSVSASSLRRITHNTTHRTALLTSSTTSLLHQLVTPPGATVASAGGGGLRTSASAGTVHLLAAASSGGASDAARAFVSVPAPALSAGIEGRGSALEIDARLGLGLALGEERPSPNKRRRTGEGAAAAAAEEEEEPESSSLFGSGAGSATATATGSGSGSGIEAAVKREAEQYARMEAWLQSRKARGQELLAHLQRFTGWEMHEVKQERVAQPTDVAAAGTGADAATSTGKSQLRLVQLRGRMQGIGAVALRFGIRDVFADVGHAAASHLTGLEVELAEPVRLALMEEEHLQR